MKYVKNYIENFNEYSEYYEGCLQQPPLLHNIKTVKILVTNLVSWYCILAEHWTFDMLLSL